MRRKYLSMTMAIAMSAFLVGGCSGNANSEYAGQTIYGQVSAVDEDSITIEIGTQKEMEMPSGTENGETKEIPEGTAEGETPELPENMEEGGMQGGGQISMLDLTGEEVKIEVDDDTVITSMSMGGSRGGMGDMGGMGQDGQMPNSGEMPEDMKLPEGMEEGQMPEKPENMEEGQMPAGEVTEIPEGTELGEAMEIPEGTELGEAMEIPEGSEMGEAPELPEGMEAGDTPQMPDGMGEASEEIELTDISEGDIVSITFDEDGDTTEIVVLSMTMDMDMNGGVENYDAVEEYTEDTEVTGETISSTGTDENAVHVCEDAIVSFSGMTVTRESKDSTGGDNSSFYGVGAAMLNTAGTMYVDDSTITTDASGAAGIFAYGSGVVYAADTKITTAQDTSGGIHAAGGGTLYAWDMEVETSGESAAAIRSDRGGGTMVVDGGTYISNGVSSPAVYSTADISVNNAVLTANGSEAICIEGLNSIRLYDCDLSGNMSDDERNDCIWNVILYQSMSGDSEVGNSTFEMYGGTLTAKNGGMFYTTNTESTFVLNDVEITNAKNSDFLLRCSGNNNQRGWGTSGKNGADCMFTAICQELKGDIIWDSISSLDFYLTDSSTLTGAVLNDETYAGEGGAGYANLYVEEGCTWVVTKDSVLSSLSNAGSIVDANGNAVTIKGSDGAIYVSGSSVTITVDSYDTKGDVSGASETTAWADYKVTKPEMLDD